MKPPLHFCINSLNLNVCGKIFSKSSYLTKKLDPIIYVTFPNSLTPLSWSRPFGLFWLKLYWRKAVSQETVWCDRPEESLSGSKFTSITQGIASIHLGGTLMPLEIVPSTRQWRRGGMTWIFLAKRHYHKKCTGSEFIMGGRGFMEIRYRYFVTELW